MIEDLNFALVLHLYVPIILQEKAPNAKEVRGKWMKYCSHTIFYCSAEARRRRSRGKLTERSLVSPEQCSGFKIAQTNSSLPWSYRLSGIVHSAVMLCLSTGSKNKQQIFIECSARARQDALPGLRGLRHWGGLSQACRWLSRRRGHILPGWL